jgi:plastocyanin
VTRLGSNTRPLKYLAAVALAATVGLVAGGASWVQAAKTVTAYAGGGETGIAVNVFRPDSLTVNFGDTVEWLNPYEEPHTLSRVLDEPVGDPAAPINPDAAISFDGTVGYSSGFFVKDQTVSVRFDAVGEYTFICIIHPGMEVVVTVVGPGVETPDGIDEAAAEATLQAGIEKGERAEARFTVPGPVANDDGQKTWTVRTGPEVDFEGSSVEVMKFFAPEVNIAAGDTVNWHNDYGVPHTITFFAGPPPDDYSPFAPAIPEGGVFDPSSLVQGVISTNPMFSDTTDFALTFNTAGTFAYICALHVDQGMAGVVNVGGGGGGITPPSTGDAGLLDHSSGAWLMLGGVALLLATFAGGATVAVRKR